MAQRSEDSAPILEGKSPRILGLTGAIACGKSTVGDILLDLGAVERIDADRVVHALMVSGTPVTTQVREAFGPEVIASDGSVDRAALGDVVFGNSARLRLLESIVHPAVRHAIRERIAEMHDENGVVVVDAVRLLQSDLLPLVEEVWVVSCPTQAQLRRLTEIRGMSRQQAQGRLDAQPSFEHERVTRVIDNSGSIEELRQQIEAAWNDFLANRRL